MQVTLIAATVVAVVSTVPPSGPSIIFRENKHTIVFNQAVDTHKVEMTDAAGCKVSQDSQVEDGTKVVVQIKACSKLGYPAGIMKVRWTVNGTSGEYDLHIRHHH